MPVWREGLNVMLLSIGEARGLWQRLREKKRGWYEGVWRNEQAEAHRDRRKRVSEHYSL